MDFWQEKTTRVSFESALMAKNTKWRTIHAEQNAISYASQYGVSLSGCECAYITHYPCLPCAKALYSTGIRRIYYHLDYNNDEFGADHLFQNGNHEGSKILLT